MKLTKYEKEAIVNAIMQDVPKPVHNVLRDEIQTKLVAAMSPEARKLYKIKPKALVTDRLSSYECLLDFGVDFVVGDADSKQVFAEYKKQAQARDDARRKLAYAVNGCNTLAQLKKLLPEFISYFPSETEPTKNLPAVANMVADLSKLGWPKSQTKTPTPAK